MFKIFRISVLVLLLAGGAGPAAAQAQLKLGTNSGTPAPAALLDLETTTQALLLPRMLAAEMAAVALPVAGLVVYCTNCTPAGLRAYDGAEWVALGTDRGPAATFVSGSLNCSGPFSAGPYIQGTPMNSTNTKNLVLAVNTGGAYTITTDTVNGIFFRASGTLLSVGSNIVIPITGFGTPVAAGNFTYTVDLGGQACSFDVNTAPAATFACGNATSAFSPVGTLVNGTSYSGTFTLPYTAGTGNTYGPATVTQNGLTLTRTAGTYATGSGTIVYTLSGTYTGSALLETFNIPEGCTVNVPSSYVSTFAGLAGSSGSTDGTGNAARFNSPGGITTDASGNMYVADRSNNTVRKITPSGTVSTLAGLAGSSGSTNGTGSAARFFGPSDVAVDAGGNLYVTDGVNHTIRKITPAGVVTTFAGSAGSAGSTDGFGSAARFNGPLGIAVDAGGNIYVADRSNQTIRKITSNGTVSTLAGSAGNMGSADGTGSAARFLFPNGITIGAGGNLYVADGFNRTIRKITPAGGVTTLAGSAGNAGSADGTGSAARFDVPIGIEADTNGNLYVADYLNHTIRKITTAGVVTTFAGSAGNAGTANGSSNAARFNGPVGVTIDATGNLFITDGLNHTIRKITP